MKKIIFILFYIFTTTGLSSIAQTNFENGFKKGFEKGSRYDKNSNLNYTSPRAPKAPLPKYSERSDSFQDGYENGLIVGGKWKKMNSKIIPNNNTSNYNLSKKVFFKPQIIGYGLSPEFIAKMNSAKAVRLNVRLVKLNGLPNLYNSIFKVKPEGINKKEPEEHKTELDNLNTSSKIIVFRSNEYIGFRKSQKLWFVSMIISGAAGAFTYTQANGYALKYKSATTDASSIKQKGNTFYTVAPICFAAAGFSLVEYIIKTKKIKKIRPNTANVYPQISPDHLGLNLIVKL